MSRVAFDRMEEDESTIWIGGEEVGTITRNVAWTGERDVVSGYEVVIELDDHEYAKDFPVAGSFGGRFGAWRQRGFDNSRQALAAAKRYVRDILER